MNSKSPKTQLILASSSPYRKMLLQRLGLDFQSMSPNMDETPLPGESVNELTKRLARGKALSIAQLYPQAVVIGSDQVAEFRGRIIGKPETVEAALSQLLLFAGNTIQFTSAICVLRVQPACCEEVAVPTLVHFRAFSRQEAERYIELDMPLDCAGAFKSEAAGLVLLRGLESTDPSALIGLPLIALSGILRSLGLQLP